MAKNIVSLLIVLAAFFLNPAMGAATYTYDKLGRVTSLAYDGYTPQKYTYDLAGNMKTISAPPALKSEQTVSFGAAPVIAVSGTGTVSATATSNLAVSFSSMTPGVCTISGSTVTSVTAGACTIAADQAGDDYFNAAARVTQSIPIGIADAPGSVIAMAGNGQATVNFSAPASDGGAAITIYTATSSPGGLTGTCAGPAACAITVVGLTNGTSYTFIVTATNSAGVGLASAASNPVTPKADQTIGALSFSPATFAVGGAATVSATATSGLAVSFSSNTPGICTVSGGTVTGIGAGTCTIAANQAGDATHDAAPQVTQDITVKASTRSDFNGDGKADIFWRDQNNGQNVVWFMNGTTVSSYAFTDSAGTNWSAVGVSDFNGDGKADILWRDQTAGTNAFWFMNAQNIASIAFTSTADSNWGVAGTGDFDGDGRQDDILWFNASTRQPVVWLTNNGQMTSYGYIYSAVPEGWSIAGAGDFDGNGKSDILWRNTNGSNVIWFMNGVNLVSTTAIATASEIWEIKGVADFDADGKADIFWQDTSGNTYVWLMDGAATKGLAPSIFAGGWTALQFADFNGDGKADILWRNAAGDTYIWLMNGLVLPAYATSMAAPLNWTAIGK